MILTNHKSLKELISQVIQTPEQQVYLSKLLGYDYSIQYKAGKSNVVADALSRFPEESLGQFLILSIPNFVFLDDLRQSLQADQECQSLFKQIAEQPTSIPDYMVHNGLIIFKDKIWLNSSNPFKRLLLEEFHTTPLGGHMGTNKTLHRLQANFTW